MLRDKWTTFKFSGILSMFALLFVCCLKFCSKLSTQIFSNLFCSLTVSSCPTNGLQKIGFKFLIHHSATLETFRIATLPSTIRGMLQREYDRILFRSSSCLGAFFCIFVSDHTKMHLRFSGFKVCGYLVVLGAVSLNLVEMLRFVQVAA